MKRNEYEQLRAAESRTVIDTTLQAVAQSIYGNSDKQHCINKYAESDKIINSCD